MEIYFLECTPTYIYLSRHISRPDISDIYYIYLIYIYIIYLIYILYIWYIYIIYLIYLSRHISRPNISDIYILYISVIYIYPDLIYLIYIPNIWCELFIIQRWATFFLQISIWFSLSRNTCERITKLETNFSGKLSDYHIYIYIF